MVRKAVGSSVLRRCGEPAVVLELGRDFVLPRIDPAALQSVKTIGPAVKRGGVVRIEDMRLLFGWVPVDDRAYDRAWRVPELLTRKGQHRNAGAVDLVVAATAELQGLTLLHRDQDFDCIAAVTGQPLQWYGPDAGK